MESSDINFNKMEEVNNIDNIDTSKNNLQNVLSSDFPYSSNSGLTQEIIIHPSTAGRATVLQIVMVTIGLIFIGVGAGIHNTFTLSLCIPIGAILLVIFLLIHPNGYFCVDPNNAIIVTLCGKYIGTVKTPGCYWANPFKGKEKISMRFNNYNGKVIKINDKVGNPIMMGCIVIWRVKDTFKAKFDVQDYNYYVSTQTESAIRFVGCMYPYDKVNDEEISLRSGADEVNKVLKEHLSQRLVKAGIEVEEARITELSYSSEIANAMLKRQAAEAIIAAREKIVQGAVSIVGHAVNSLKDNNICDLKDDEKSKLVSNMLVVLCSESQVNPVVNTGSS